MTAVETLRKMTGEVGNSDYSDADLSAILESSNGDLNQAAATVWEWKAAAIATNYDFSADGGTYNRSQAYEHCKKQAAHYRSRCKAGTIELVKHPPERRVDCVHCNRT